MKLLSDGGGARAGLARRQQRHEIGIRMALGARPLDVVSRLVGDTARSVAIGSVVGLVLSIAGAKGV